MKTHPSVQQLMGYFENDLRAKDDDKIKKHLEDCTQCLDQLSGWANVDSVFKKEAIQLEDSKRIHLFNAAFAALDARSANLEERDLRVENRAKRVKRSFEIKDMIFDVLQKPSLSLGALSLGIVLIYNISKKSEYEKRVILDGGVSVYYSEGRGSND